LRLNSSGYGCELFAGTPGLISYRPCCRLSYVPCDSVIGTKFLQFVPAYRDSLCGLRHGM